MNQKQEKGMVRVGQRNCYLVAAEAKHSPCETLEKSICNQEMRSSLCLQNNMSPTGKCRAQPEVTQLCTQLPGCEEPSEHETSCITTYWNAKKFAWNPNGSQSASVSLGIPLSCRKSWGLRWRSYHQVIQKISRDFSFLSRTQGSTHTHVEPAKKSATSLMFRSQQLAQFLLNALYFCHG